MAVKGEVDYIRGIFCIILLVLWSSQVLTLWVCIPGFAFIHRIEGSFVFNNKLQKTSDMVKAPPWLLIVMSPGNLTFNCVDFNKMSMEHAFYCNSVAGLYARASLIIKAICFAQISSFIVDELRESVGERMFSRLKQNAK